MYGYTIFHEGLMDTLINNVREGKNANTYIFEGEPGLGKSEAAQLFAAALVCGNTASAPCLSCSSCIEAKAGSHPDIIHVKKEDKKTVIGVDVIRRVIAEGLTKPFYSKHKVFIVDDGDILNDAAQNTFLKLIEEPPEYAVFIIVCTSAAALLQTVRSRAVIISFPPVSDEKVHDYIAEKYPDEPRIDFLTKFCAGIPKRADEIIMRSDFEELREKVLGIISRIMSSNMKYAFDISDFFDAHADKADEICDMLLLYLRDGLVTAVGKGDAVINTDKNDIVLKLAQSYTPQKIAHKMDEVMTAKKMLAKHIKPSAVGLHLALKS